MIRPRDERKDYLFTGDAPEPNRVLLTAEDNPRRMVASSLRQNDVGDILLDANRKLEVGSISSTASRAGTLYLGNIIYGDDTTTPRRISESSGVLSFEYNSGAGYDTKATLDFTDGTLVLGTDPDSGSSALLRVGGAGLFGGTVTASDGTESDPGLRLTSVASGIFKRSGAFAGVGISDSGTEVLAGRAGYNYVGSTRGDVGTLVASGVRPSTSVSDGMVYDIATWGRAAMLLRGGGSAANLAIEFHVEASSTQTPGDPFSALQMRILPTTPGTPSASQVLIGNGTLKAGGAGLFGGVSKISHSTNGDNSAIIENTSSTGFGAIIRGGNASNYALRVRDYNNTDILLAYTSGVTIYGSTPGTPTSGQVLIGGGALKTGGKLTCAGQTTAGMTTLANVITFLQAIHT